MRRPPSVIEKPEVNSAFSELNKMVNLLNIHNPTIVSWVTGAFVTDVIEVTYYFIPNHHVFLNLTKNF